jgi:hypothetical protein
MKQIITIVAFLFLTTVWAQHDHHMPAADKPAPTKQSQKKKQTTAPKTVPHETSEKTTKTDTLADQTHQHEHAANAMSHAFSLNLPMSRNGSGTGWLPDASPMYGVMLHKNSWMFMLHGNLFVRYNNQDFTGKGSRGDKEFDAPNWIMAMGQRKVGQKGLFHFNTMFSFDALTGGNDGYPLLFQSGESYRGAPLVDRQHPHDLFSELSVSYAHSFDKNTDAFIYLAYPGEPALGAVAFMHRPSALYNPDAPLSHHWVDATHVTFGVATAGFRFRDFKLEGSVFTGREPDEHRYDFDQPKFDSWSSRLSYNPTKNWALQISHGLLKSPEALEPDEDIRRTTASAAYALPLTNGSLNAIVLWGMNKKADDAGENAFLAEAALQHRKFAIHFRYEFVEKSTHELNLESQFGDEIFAVNAFTLGVNYDVWNIGKLNLQAGSQISYYSASDKLDGLYGSNPMAFEIYLRLYPALMKM